MEEDKLDKSNICFFEYSFIPRLLNKKNEPLKNVETLFKNIMTYKKPFEYKPRTELWLLCMTDFEPIKIDSNEFLFAVLNRMHSKKIEIFDWKTFKEKETEIKNVIEEKWKFIVIPNLKIIVTEYSERFSAQLFKKIFTNLWNEINHDSFYNINLKEKEEKWTYCSVIREFDEICELSFKNVPYPNPISGQSIKEGRELFNRLRIEILEQFKMKGQSGKGVNAEELLLASLARIVEKKKKGGFEGEGISKGKHRMFQSGISKITAIINYSKDDIQDFVKKTKEKIDELFFKRF